MKTNFNLKTTDTEVLRNLARDIHIELNARTALRRARAIKDFEAAFLALKNKGFSIKYETNDGSFTIDDWDNFTFTKVAPPEMKRRF